MYFYKYYNESIIIFPLKVRDCIYAWRKKFLKGRGEFESILVQQWKFLLF